MAIEGVHGVIVIAADGTVMMSRFSDAHGAEQSRIGKIEWASFVAELAEADEAELVFDRRRIYARKIRAGFFLAILDDIAPVSMVRLNCEILLPSLDRLKPAGRIGKILKKRIF